MLTRASRLSKIKQNKILQAFVGDMEATQASKFANVSRECVNRYYRHFREVIYQNSKAPRFSGEIEMDQSEFGGRRRKEVLKRLKELGKKLSHKEYMEVVKEVRKGSKVTVFGIRQRHGDVYTCVIEKANRETLQPIIQLVVEPGSTVYTDQWRGFGDLGLQGYKHKTVNHSEEYRSKDGAHTNGIEAFWSVAKRRLRKFNGISSTTLRLHVKECEFRFNNRDMEKALRELLKKAQA